MILLAGGSGRLGRTLLPLLVGDGIPVRVLTRSAEAAARLRRDGAESLVGDIRRSTDVAAAVAGCSAVISAVSGFGPMGSSTPATVDRDGNARLVRASEAAGVQHFVLVSAYGAAADAPLPLMRLKYAAEQTLTNSTLGWTIIRPTSYLETQLDAIGGPLKKKGSTVVFGRGNVAANFVSVADVAALIRHVLHDPASRGQIIDWGGPNLTLNELSEALHSAAGTSGTTQRIPLPVLRLMSVAARPFSPFLARVARAAVVLNTTDMTFDDGPARKLLQGLPRTGLAAAMPGAVGQ